MVNTYLNGYGDYLWGGKETKLYSNFRDSSSSHIDVWYNASHDKLRFGEIKVTAAENIGGAAEEPKIYEKEFDYKDVASTQMYIAQLFSTNPEIEVDDGSGYKTVFKSSAPRSAPTRVHIERSYYDVDARNKIRLSDIDDSPERSYLPESAFEWTTWVPSQVGYGDLYPNQTAALEDAKERLRDRLGPFVDATGIDTSQVSTGSQPYIWGPASLKLVVWRE